MSRTPKTGASSLAGEEPRRWSAGGGAADLEARAGLLLRQAIERQPLGAARLDAIEARLEQVPRRRSRPLLWQVAVGLALLLSGGALVGAATHLFRPGPAHEDPRPQPRLLHGPTSPSHHVRKSAEQEAPAAVVNAPVEGPREEPPGVSSAPASAAGSQGVRRPTVAAPAPRRSASPFPAASVDDGPSPLAREARRLADALHKLRQDDDPAGALALLDGAGAEVPGAGLLKAETNAARVEALLRLHRSEQALSLLDAMTIGPRGPDRERLVTRAELRGRAGRCAEAIADFDALLAGPAPARRPDAMTERALFGRAACRGQRHDQAGARADLTRYLALFPDGRFAAAARDVLRPRAP